MKDNIQQKRQLILLAAVECQYTNNWNDDTTDEILRKVRIYDDDLIANDSIVPDNNDKTDEIICTGRHLHEVIKKQCYSGTDLGKESGDNEGKKTATSTTTVTTAPTTGEETTSSKKSFIRIEIYNPRNNQFESILDPDVIDCNIVMNYGNRIRCILYIDEIKTDMSRSSVSKDKGTDQNDANNARTSNILQIMGRYFPYDSNGMNFAGKNMIVKEKVNNKIDGTGLNVWDGALLLALYLERLPDKVRSKSILELGAGTGFVGIAASFLDPDKIVLTDLEYTMTLMNENISLNEDTIFNKERRGSHNNQIDCYDTKIKCQVCDWFNPPPIGVFEFNSIHPEIILVADCIWIEELVDPLMNTLDKYCSNETIVIITYQQRGKVAHDKFWSRLRGIFDGILIVETENVCGLEKPDSFSVIECSKGSAIRQLRQSRQIDGGYASTNQN